MNLRNTQTLDNAATADSRATMLSHSNQTRAGTLDHFMAPENHSTDEDSHQLFPTPSDSCSETEEKKPRKETRPFRRSQKPSLFPRTLTTEPVPLMQTFNAIAATRVTPPSL